MIVVHRLLKNEVDEATGIAAYALYSESLRRGDGHRRPGRGRAWSSTARRTSTSARSRPGSATSTRPGRTRCERARVVVEPKDADPDVRAGLLPRPPALVWEYLTSPAAGRSGSTAVDRHRRVAGTAGRRGVGTTNHCIHGKDAVVEEILDWRPYDYLTYRSQLPIPNVPKLVNGYVFDDLGDGRTSVEIRFAPAAVGEGPGDRRVAAAGASTGCSRTGWPP